MPDPIYGFNKQDKDAIVAGIGGNGGEQRHFTHPTYSPGPLVHAKTPVGGIPAISTLTMGSASCDIYACSSAGVLSDSGNNATIYNMASSAVAGETQIIAARNAAGLLVVIVEDCGA